MKTRYAIYILFIALWFVSSILISVFKGIFSIFSPNCNNKKVLSALRQSKKKMSIADIIKALGLTIDCRTIGAALTSLIHKGLVEQSSTEESEITKFWSTK